MPKPINKTIGKCLCYSRNCLEHADIRKVKNERELYLNCPTCGIVRPKGQAFQDYVLENGRFDSPAPIPEPEEIKPGEKMEVKKEDGSEKDFNFQTDIEDEIKKPEKGFLEKLNDWEL